MSEEIGQALSYSRSPGPLRAGISFKATAFDLGFTNAYSYALNRPLTFTDRDGDVPVAAVAGYFALFALAGIISDVAWEMAHAPNGASFRDLDIDPAEAAFKGVAAGAASLFLMALTPAGLPAALPAGDLVLGTIGGSFWSSYIVGGIRNEYVTWDIEMIDIPVGQDCSPSVCSP